ncbi:MAG: NAD(P)/FAD-dependent oxidoreductase [Chitinophagales bacterium]|nr:NAD(P)/FAD-dependent oxidoreductase [Chitinophagales bacterium]
MTSRAKKYDVVIIGSGLGGLVCGAVLSKEGRSVCIIEKNEQLGGCLQTFRRDSITFDTGVHYIGGLEKGKSLWKIFNYLGIMGRLETVKMNEGGFDVVAFKGDADEYPYGMGYENFQRILLQKFPDEKNAIEKYCTDIQQICASVPLYNLSAEEQSDDTWAFTTGVKNYLEQLTPNKKLQNILAGTNLLYAGIADKTPLYVHALVVNSYIESAHRIKNGGDQIAKLLARVVKENGGEILRKQEVKKINTTNGIAESVELSNGRKIYGALFISGIHPAKTLELTDSDALRPAYRNRIAGLENSVSTFVLYAVLKPGTFPYLNRNYYYFNQDDVWQTATHTNESWPNMYALFEEVPEKNNQYTEGISIMTYMRFDEVAKWKNTFHTTLYENMRDEAYQQFKREKAEKLLDVVAIKFPNIRECVQSYYTSTPLSYRDYMGTDDGSMYGIVKDYNEPMKSMISVKTKVPNLLLTGQSINLHGVLGVTECALLTCMSILGKEYLLNKIHEANA